jgi:hypothetical protein
MAESTRLDDLHDLREQLLCRLNGAGGAFWRRRINDCFVAPPPHQLHLAIFQEPFLSLLLDGRKTIESRFSVNRIAPYQQARADDLVLIKEASGPVVGLCLLDHPGYYELDEESWESIPREFGERICAGGAEFWDARRHARYASLLPVKAIVLIDPLRVAKRDRRGWVVLNTRTAPTATQRRRVAASA